MKTPEFVGYDRDNDRVWRFEDGKVISADTAESAMSWVRTLGRSPVLNLEQYIMHYGPITGEPQ